MSKQNVEALIVATLKLGGMDLSKATQAAQILSKHLRLK